MLNDNKANKRRTAGNAIGLFLMGALFTLLAVTEFADITGEGAEPPQTGDVGTARETVLSANEVTEYVTRFTLCDHEVTRTVTGADAGLTRRGLAEAHEGYEVELFDEDHARLTRTADGCCGAHYTLRAGTGELIITRRDETTLEDVEVMRIKTDAVPQDAAGLAQGITFDTLEEINAYLEGAE